MGDKRTDRSRDDSRPASALNVVAGIWLFISAWALGASWLPVARTNTLVVGLAVLIVAAIRLATPRTAFLSWLNVLLAIWLFISPFLLSFYVLVDATANSIIVGILIGSNALWAAYTTRSTVPSPRQNEKQSNPEARDVH
jgi:hypothetical protein